MEMVPVVLIMPYPHVYVTRDGQECHVQSHVSMERHKLTTPVFVMLVILEQSVTYCVVVMDHVLMATVHVTQHGGVS